MAARKSCTHMTWAEAKAKSGVATSKSSKAKQPPKQLDHGKLLAAKIVAKQSNNVPEEDMIKGRQAARQARKAMERQEQLDAKREAEKEQQRLQDVVRPHELAFERLDELAEEYQEKRDGSTDQSSVSSDDWNDICESKQMQVDEMIALEAIYADSNLLKIATKLEELQEKVEDWQSDPDDTEKKRELVNHRPISFTLKRSFEDPNNDDLVAHMFFKVDFPFDYPLHATPIMNIVWFLLTSKSMTVSSNKPLDSTNMGTLNEADLQQALTEQAKELEGMPSIYEVLDTYLSEHVFDFIERSVSNKKKVSCARRRNRIFYTVDVLTDGSEYTGHGTLFLSVWKSPPPPPLPSSTTATSQNKDDNEDNPISEAALLARYAISGVGDALARLAADQRFKLAPTRACFVPQYGCCLDGLSALLLALYGAGSPSLHVVLPPRNDSGDVVEELASITLGSYKHLDIRTCQVQEPPEGEPPFSWWKVYEDEFLEVHASCCMETIGGYRSIIYLYSFCTIQDGPVMTLAVLPPQCCMLVDIFQRQLANPKTLPVARGRQISIIKYVIVLNPNCQQHDLKHLFGKYPRTTFLLTDPQNDRCDKGLFIRSQQLATYFHDNMPWAFVAPRGVDGPTIVPTIPTASILQSATSCVIREDESRLIVVDRGNEIVDCDLKAEWVSTHESLKSFVPQPPTNIDESEIDLEEGSDCGDEDSPYQDHISCLPSPRLLVLGTGCATPSPHRGASGYALLMPEQQNEHIFILDCGEGVPNMLSRTCVPNLDWTKRIRGIWISHAHLDHYGGLPSLLRILHEERMKSNANTTEGGEPELKKRRHAATDQFVPWVMAPSKVLRYLDILLDCRRGYLKNTRMDKCVHEVFLPRVHNDPTLVNAPPAGPWIHFENVNVYHNCCPAYGLLLGWRDGATGKCQYLCYSGDTRPCGPLVQACRSALRRNQLCSLTLIHEATFSNEDQDNAQKKKHSTVSEAVRIGLDIPASKLLLTHFSQRYNRSLQASDSAGTMPVGLATDGLWMQLP